MSQILKGIKFPGMDDVFIAPNDNNMPYTTIRKVGKHKVKNKTTGQTTVLPRKVYLDFHNLVPGRTYTIKAYTKQRKDGKDSGKWYFNPQLKDDKHTPQCLGYVAYYLSEVASGRSPDVPPSWMPNGGFLQNTWTITAKKTDYTMELPLETWLLDLTHYNSKAGYWLLLGGGRRPRQFKFRIYDPIEEYEGECRDTLLVNNLQTTNGEDCVVGFVAIT